MTVAEVRARKEHLEGQIQALADRILKVEGEPSVEGGAVDAAIHLIDELETRRVLMAGLTDKQIERLAKQARRRDGMQRLGTADLRKPSTKATLSPMLAGAVGVAVGAVLASSPHLPSLGSALSALFASQPPDDETL